MKNLCACVSGRTEKHAKRHLTRVENDENFSGPEITAEKKKEAVCHSSQAIDCSTHEPRAKEEWETQQTSGITKTKLKFFIGNKRRVERGRSERWIRWRSYLLIWSHFKLSLLSFPSIFISLRGHLWIFSWWRHCDKRAITQRGYSI